MIDWSITVLTFPGQGSQVVGMGADLAAHYPVAKATFDEADSIYGAGFSKMLFEGPAEALDRTDNTQPALYVVGMAAYRVLEALYGPLTPMATAGHSLGEFTALTAAGALSYADGLRLVRERGRLMYEAGEISPGGMAALLGAEMDDARAICEAAQAATGKPVVIANDNCPGQIVVSGDNQAVDRAIELAEERGIKRAIRLAVSVATHSPLMAHASADFQKALNATAFSTPKVPIIGNTTAAALHSTEDILAELRAQLTQTVRWAESVRTLRALGAQIFVEPGSKDVLTGLLKRIDRSATGIAVNSVASIQALATR